MTPLFVCLSSFFFFSLLSSENCCFFLLCQALPPPLTPTTVASHHSYMGGHQSMLLLFILNGSSILPFSSLSSHTSICSSPFFLYLLSKSKRQKKGELVLCVFGLSLCSAKRTRLLNPSSGFGTKGRLRSCKSALELTLSLSTFP